MSKRSLVLLQNFGFRPFAIGGRVAAASNTPGGVCCHHMFCPSSSEVSSSDRMEASDNRTGVIKWLSGLMDTREPDVTSKSYTHLPALCPRWLRDAATLPPIDAAPRCLKS